jgi:predicted DNA-binding protein YlxM (UPF0122 family)
LFSENLMKLLKLLLILFTPNLAFAQKEFTIYEVGRPAAVEYNNAKYTVGQKWNINWVYADDQSMENIGHELIGAHNDSVFTLLSRIKGETWQTQFFKEVEQELELQNKLREEIKNQKFFNDIKQEVYEPIILFERTNPKKDKAFLVHVVGKVQRENFDGFITLCSFQTKVKKIPSNVACQEKPLTITFPQNNIK